MTFKTVLKHHNVDFLISFCQENRVGVYNGDVLIEQPLPRPMGICILGGGIAIATKHGIVAFSEIQDSKSDRLYLRQSNTQYMGFVDGHELVSVKGVPVLANTLFSCLSTLSLTKDFQVVYQPPFAKELLPEDRIHLNGVAIEKNIIRYISCFSTINTAEYKGWRQSPGTGCVWDVITNRPVITDLALPHSPRIIDNKLYICESGKGRLLVRDGDELKVVANIGSFVRGAIALGDYLIIGTSKIREGRKNPQLDRSCLQENQCGLVLLDRHNYEVCDRVTFEDKTEIFDLQAIEKGRIFLTADSQEFAKLHLV